VFAIDLRDGTNTYTEDINGNGMIIDWNQDLYEKEKRVRESIQRRKEFDAFVDEVMDWQVLRKSLFGIE